MTLERLNALLVQTTAELDEINQSSHPFRAEFRKGWEARILAVKANIADEKARAANAAA